MDIIDKKILALDLLLLDDSIKTEDSELEKIKQDAKVNKKEITKEEAEKILKETHKHDHDHDHEKEKKETKKKTSEKTTKEKKPATKKPKSKLEVKKAKKVSKK